MYAAPEMTDEQRELIEEITKPAECKFEPTIEQEIAAERKRIDEAQEKIDQQRKDEAEGLATALHMAANGAKVQRAYKDMLVSQGFRQKDRAPQTAKQKAAAKKKRKAQSASRRKNRR